jgi:hypothetical protein
LLHPGETYDSVADSGRYDVVPLTEEVKGQLRRKQGWELKDRMSNVYIMLVDRAVFADGSVYKDTKTAAALMTRLQEGDQ